MSLVRWNNSDMMFPALSTILDEFLGDVNTVNGSNINRYVPAVNIFETENDFQLEIAAPGMRKEHFNIHVDDKKLTISAEQKEEAESKVKYARKEFGYKTFKRTFALPNSVNIDKISASYEDGILKLTVPKKEEVKPRTIAIA